MLCLQKVKNATTTNSVLFLTKKLNKLNMFFLTESCKAVFLIIDLFCIFWLTAFFCARLSNI